MNIEIEIANCINTILGALRKLRIEACKLGMAETSTEDMARQVPLYYCTCPTEIPCPVHDKNYQIIRERLGMAGTEPKCTCKHPDPTLHPDTEPDKLFLLDIKCPKHGKIIWLDKTPDLPLRARVAKALGWAVTIDKLDGKWIGHHKSITSGVWWYSIPDYDKHRDLAMGALEEYADKNCSIYIIRRNRTKDYQIVLYPPMTSDTARWHYETSLSQAICEAIVAHTEQAK